MSLVGLKFKMKQQEATKYKDKNVRIVLTNNYRYSGKVLEIGEESLILFDKFNSKISLRLANLMIVEVIE